MNIIRKIIKQFEARVLTIVLLCFIKTALCQTGLPVGPYKVTGWIFHPTAGRIIDKVKNLNSISAIRYEGAIADLGGLLGSDYEMQFDYTNGQLVNFSTADGIPLSANFMTLDNPGGYSYPGNNGNVPGDINFNNTIYNNTYDSATHTLWLHYGYSTSGSGLDQYSFSRQIYEKWELIPNTISFTPAYGCQATTVNISGVNFLGATSVKFGNTNALFFTVNSPTSITAIAPAGANGQIKVLSPMGIGISSSLFLSVSSPTNFAYIPNFDSSSVSVINTSNNIITGNVKVGAWPWGVSVSPNGSKVYVTNEGSGTVSVINTATNAVSNTIYTGANSHGICVSPDGSKVYVANNSNDNSITVINAVTNSVITTILSVYAAENLCVSPDGSKVYVTCSSAKSMYVINTTTNTLSTTIPLLDVADDICVSPDGSKIYLSTANYITIIDATTNLIQTTIPAGPNASGICVSPDGSKVYVAGYNSNNVSIINTATNTVSNTLAILTAPEGISITPDGAKVFIISHDSISVINTIDNSVTFFSGKDRLFAYGNFIGQVTCTAACTTNYWTGAISTAWENAGNWSCGVLPDVYSDVILPSSAIVVINSNVFIASLSLNPTASLTINPLYKLTLLGH